MAGGDSSMRRGLLLPRPGRLSIVLVLSNVLVAGARSLARTECPDGGCPLASGFEGATSSKRFFIYKSPRLHFRSLMDKCDPPSEDKEMVSGGYTAVTDMLLAQLADSPHRLEHPEDARWFIVPFNIDRSFAVGWCEGTTHISRLTSVLKELEKTATFKRRDGKDHIWMNAKWKFCVDCYNKAAGGAQYFPQERRKLLANMVIGRYLNHHLHDSSIAQSALGRQDPHYGFSLGRQGGKVWWTTTEDWRCTAEIPVMTPRALTREMDWSYESWKKRPTLLHYRGHDSAEKPRPCLRGADVLHDIASTLNATIPNSVTSSKRASAYADEVRSSKFCLVLRCDDPQTSRFVDALAGGCIPVIVDDGFNLVVAPFSRMLNYNSFSVSIPESMYLRDPLTAMRFAYNWPDSITKQLYENLIRERPKLNWRVPAGQKSEVAEMVLEQVSQDCAY